jgi:hypothetical protein
MAHFWLINSGFWFQIQPKSNLFLFQAQKLPNQFQENMWKEIGKQHVSNAG